MTVLEQLGLEGGAPKPQPWEDPGLLLPVLTLMSILTLSTAITAGICCLLSSGSVSGCVVHEPSPGLELSLHLHQDAALWGGRS